MNNIKDLQKKLKVVFEKSTLEDLPILIKELDKYVLFEKYPTKPQDVIYSEWWTDDVKSVAHDLTNSEAKKVLSLCKSEHDANIGINWDTIKVWADVVREDRNK